MDICWILKRPCRTYFARKLFSNCNIFTGMVLCLCMTSTTSGKCKPMDFSSRYECEGYQDGVRDLDCFGRHASTIIMWMCVWTLGEHASRNVFTLAILQQPHSKLLCEDIKNISGTSTNFTHLYKQINMTVYVFKESDPRNCTAIFRGLPTSLVRCDPPYNVTFIRHVRQLHATVTWREEDRHAIQHYFLRYKTPGSLLWDESLVRSRDAGKSTVGPLNSSLGYKVQIQCVSNSRCSQCPWSEVYTVPPELTLPPTLLKIEDVEFAERKGCRLLSLTWKFPVSELVEGYKVAMWKASGETKRVWMNTTEAKITLILSYSAYGISIIAFNNASTSPAVSTTILPQQNISSTEAGRLNVTANSNISYTISWKDDLIKTYCCFAVEWCIRAHKLYYTSFFEKKKNYKTISFTEPLEPYKRYTVTLHTRPNKDTCNLKHINNSESTYASVHFYFIEGTPVGAPTNISYSATLNSVALQWRPPLEEDLRGFLLGYVIYYIEYQQRTTGIEKNVTVGPGSNSHVLKDLESETVYRLQVSAVTSAGEGVRSAESYFEMNSQGYLSASGVKVVFGLVAVVMICSFAFLFLKRVKLMFWPSIPNPGNSSAMQKTMESHELDLLKPINIQQLREWDADSLYIVDKGNESRSEPLPTVLSSHPDTQAERSSVSPEAANADSFQKDAGDTSGHVFSDHTGAASADTIQMVPSSHGNFVGDYTTVEMFQQAMPQSGLGTAMASQAAGHQSAEPGETVTASREGYVRQFSTSPVSNDEEFYLFGRAISADEPGQGLLSDHYSSD